MTLIVTNNQGQLLTEKTGQTIVLLHHDWLNLRIPCYSRLESCIKISILLLKIVEELLVSTSLQTEFLFPASKGKKKISAMEDKFLKELLITLTRFWSKCSGLFKSRIKLENSTYLNIKTHLSKYLMNSFHIVLSNPCSKCY